MKSSTTSRDFFLYLFSIITIIASVVSFITMWFAFIDVKFPVGFEQYTAYGPQIRNSIAILMVMFPVYLALAWHLRKDRLANPEKEEMGMRKFSVHFTLFVAALTIIIDFITVINSFLEGDLTARFILKVLVVLFAAGSVFAYQFWDLKRGTDAKSPSKALASAALVVVLGSIMSGFFIIGSPMTQRKLRLDERRVNDLQQINNQIAYYAQSKKALPQNLQELEGLNASPFKTPLDPETEEPYAFEKTADLSYRLCATFSTDRSYAGNGVERGTSVTPAFYNYGNFVGWDHTAGRHCFDQKIDPAFYSLERPPLKF